MTFFTFRPHGAFARQPAVQDGSGASGRRVGWAGISAFALASLALAFALPAHASQDLLDRAFDLHGDGRLGEALEAYLGYGALTDADPLDRGLAFNNASAIQLDLGRYADALVSCRSALDLLDGSGEDDLVAQSLNNCGLAQQRLGSLREAREHFELALEINRRLDLPEAVAINRANLGALASIQGRLGTALAEYERLEALASQHAGTEWADRQRTIAVINRGVVLEQIGEFRQALSLYLELLGAGSPDGVRDRAAVLVNVAILYRNLGDPRTAIGYLDRARELYASAGDAGGAGSVLLNRGIVRHLNLADPVGARRDYSEALQLARGTGDRLTEIQALVYLGRLVSEEGQADEAIGRLDAARELAVRNEYGEGEWWANIALGQALVDRDPDRAAALTREAVGAVERAALDLAGRPERGSFAAGRRELFEVAVETLAQASALRPAAGYVREALRAAELAKAWELTERLKVRIAPQALETVAARLGDDGAALTLLLTARRSFAWLQVAGDVRMVELASGDELREVLERVRADLLSETGPPAADLDYLSERILGPFVDRLATVDRLYVSPDGPTSYLPFDLLPDPNDPSRQVIDRWELTYLPVTAMLATPDRSDSGSETGFVGLVPGATAGPASRPFRLPPLTHADAEVTAARDWLGGGLVHRGSGATIAALQDSMERGARVIHVAAHSVFSDGQSRGGAVVLEPGPTDDGLLFADEIAGFEGHVDLVVLAACSTAVSPTGGMSALSSLTGAFMVAGASSVLASLWDVDDAASAAFMEQLYFELRRGRAPAAAVRNAKLRLRDRGFHERPGAWAAYVLVGEAEPLFAPAVGWQRWGIAAALLVAAAILLFAWSRTPTEASKT